MVTGSLAVEYVMNVRYKLRMMGVPIMGPTNCFCDNASVVKNASIPHSTLKKKHNSIAYHRVREAVAATSIRVGFEKGINNLSDVLTKFLGKISFYKCVVCILHN